MLIYLTSMSAIEFSFKNRVYLDDFEIANPTDSDCWPVVVRKLIALKHVHLSGCVVGKGEHWSAEVCTWKVWLDSSNYVCYLPVFLGLLEEITLKSREYLHTILPIMTRSLGTPEAVSKFTFNKALVVNNSALSAKVNWLNFSTRFYLTIKY